MTERMKEGCWEKETQSGEEKWQRRETVQKSYWFLAFRGFWPLTFYLLSCTKLLFFLPLSFHFLLCFPLFILSLYIFISRHNVCFLFFFCSPTLDFSFPLTLGLSHSLKPLRAPADESTREENNLLLHCWWGITGRGNREEMVVSVLTLSSCQTGGWCFSKGLWVEIRSKERGR